MSKISSPISPRLRPREPVGAPVSSPPPLPPAPSPKTEPAGLRVLLRLPNVAAASPASRTARFRFADRLFSTLRRKYAALSLVVFIVCVSAMLLRGKRTSPPQDDAAEAPRWNSAVAAPRSVAVPKGDGVARGASAPAGANVQMTVAPPHDDRPLPWQPAPTPFGNAAYRPAVEASAANRSFAGPTSTSSSNPNLSASKPSFGDSTPSMASHYPGRDDAADRTATTRWLPPTWAAAPSDPPKDVRVAQRPSGPIGGPYGGAALSERTPSAMLPQAVQQPAIRDTSGLGPSIYSQHADPSGQVRLENRIDAPPIQPGYAPGGTQGPR